MQGRKENKNAKNSREKSSGAKKAQQGSGKLQDIPQAIRVPSSAPGLCTTVQSLNSTGIGPLHSFKLSPSWHGLKVFLKDILYHHVRVSPATLVLEATLRHLYTCFFQKRTCNTLWQHSTARKLPNLSFFTPKKAEISVAGGPYQFSWALARNKGMIHCLFLHWHQSVFDSVSAASSSLSKKQLYRLHHERRISGFCSWLMTSCCNASGLHLELNNFRKLIEELSKQGEGEKL